ncbi:hypothetical protein FB45DRAFT_862743 [Roridomyces roridus]|uniref:Uncharacterized protein n=1 Tax=Roridomyces roridus TaxID=1738132 RepID=A0AAD7C7W7_9AGAR|nr:hypothetical protein FB45DRAFT_862743 [Roridomyces roridus]
MPMTAGNVSDDGRDELCVGPGEHRNCSAGQRESGSINKGLGSRRKRQKNIPWLKAKPSLSRVALAKQRPATAAYLHAGEYEVLGSTERAAATTHWVCQAPTQSPDSCAWAGCGREDEEGVGEQRTARQWERENRLQSHEKPVVATETPAVGVVVEWEKDKSTYLDTTEPVPSPRTASSCLYCQWWLDGCVAGPKSGREQAGASNADGSSELRGLYLLGALGKRAARASGVLRPSLGSMGAEEGE